MENWYAISRTYFELNSPFLLFFSKEKLNIRVDSPDTNFLGKWHVRKMEEDQLGSGILYWTNGNEIFGMGRPRGMDSSLLNLESQNPLHGGRGKSYIGIQTIKSPWKNNTNYKTNAGMPNTRIHIIFRV